MLYGLFLYRARIDTHLHTHVYTYVSRLARALVCYIYRYKRRAANEFFLSSPLSHFLGRRNRCEVCTSCASVEQQVVMIRVRGFLWVTDCFGVISKGCAPKLRMEFGRMCVYRTIKRWLMVANVCRFVIHNSCWFRVECRLAGFNF